MTVTPIHGVKKPAKRFELVDPDLEDLSDGELKKLHPTVARALDMQWIKRKDLVRMKRVKSLVDLPLQGVKAGDLGGLIVHNDALSQTDQTWVAFGGLLLGSTTIRGSVLVGTKTILFSTQASGSVFILGQASLRRCTITGGGIIHGVILADDTTVTGTVDIGGHHRITRSIISGDYIPNDPPILGTKLDGKCHISDSVIDGHPHVTDSRIKRSTIGGYPNVRRCTITGSSVYDSASVTGAVIAGGCSVGGESQIRVGASLKSGVKASGRSIIDGAVTGPYTVLDDVFIPKGVILTESGPHKVTLAGSARLHPPVDRRAARAKDVADALEEAGRLFPDAQSSGQAFPVNL